MKSIGVLTQMVFLAVFFSIVASPKTEGSVSKSGFGSESLINTISGQVWDPYNNPVSDIYVELINGNYSSVARQRTYAGRYVFRGIAEGNYQVKVLTTGTDYLEQTQDAQIINLDRRNSSDSVYIDFRLKFDPRKIALGSGGVPEETFVQDGISNEARKHYRKGGEMLSDKKDKGLDEIEQSLQISPNYFDALNRLGTEYVKRKDYLKAVQYLIKAIDINQRSYSSFYALAFAAYQMNRIPEAVEAARAATIIKPGLVNGQWLYGTVLRINGNYEKSEKALLQAKKLSKIPLPEIHWQLALLYNKLDRNKEAVAELEYYLKIQPELPNKKDVQDLIAKLRTKAE
jgi:tetratricopeptide (TPR) repeat protein